MEEAAKVLAALARRRQTDSGIAAPIGAWRPQGTRYVDPDGTADVSNIQGFAQGSGASPWISWHEYGTVFRLQRTGSTGKVMYKVDSVSAFKRVSCAATKRNVRVNADGEEAEFKGVVIFDPRGNALGCTMPRYTFIYLHSFSLRGADYFDFPHYFGISGAAVRVVVPTAPQLEQTCFKDWLVWRGDRLRWRRIRFNSWFDYLTDRAGKCENDLDIESLIRMRARIHGLIRSEVQRVGDPKCVIVGGASQGCCVALDAAMTYPEELGGVIGLVGHILGSTPLDPAKRSMPLHLFHEASDREMNWKWVKGTVQRLVDGGYNVISRREQDPSGSGHWIQDIEGPWIRGALRRIIFSGRASKA